MHSPDRRRFLSVCLALAFLALGSRAFGAQAQSDDKVSLLIRQLSDQDYQVRNQAARQLGDLKDARAVEPLIAVLLDPSRDMVIHAADALGKIKDARAVDPLISVLKSKDSGDRLFAAKALGEIGDPRAVLPLLPLLADASIGVLQTAAEALRQIRSVKLLDPAVDSKVEAAMAEAIPGLIEASRSSDMLTRNSAAEALGVFNDPRAVEPLLALLKDELTGTRGKAARSLGYLKDSRAVEPLRIQMVNDSDLFARNSAGWALRDMGPSGVPALAGVLKTGNLEARTLAADMLSAVGGAGTEALIALLGDPDVQIRLSAVRGMELARDNRVVEPLIALLKDKDARVRAAAAQSLQFHPDPRSEAPLVACLSDKDPEVRKKAAGAFAHLESPAAVLPLIGMLKDRDESVVKAAEDALWFYGDKASDELVFVITAGNPELIERVAGLLMRVPVQPDKLYPLLNIPNGKIRLPAALILNSHGDPMGRDALGRLLAERNPDLKLRAARALIDGGEDANKIVVDHTLRTRDVELAGSFYEFFIKMGVQGSESVLCEALKESVGSGMAEAFLNCGNITLSIAARDWAKEKGYSIVSTGGESGVRWGKRK